MGRQITLDSIKPSGLNIWELNGIIRVEANYAILAGTEVVTQTSKDVTVLVTDEQKLTLTQAYAAIFAAIEQQELGQ